MQKMVYGQKNCEHFNFGFSLRKRLANDFRRVDNICMESMEVVKKGFFKYMQNFG